MARYCLVLLSGNERQQLFMDLSCTFVSFLEIRGGPCNPVRVALNSQTAVFRNAFSKSVYFAIFLQRIVTKTFRTSIQRTSYRLCNWQSASLYIPQRRTFHYNVALFPLWSHCSSGEKRRALNLCLENSPLAFRIAKSDARSVCRHTRPNSCPAQQPESKYVNIHLSSSSLMISNTNKIHNSERTSFAPDVRVVQVTFLIHAAYSRSSHACHWITSKSPLIHAAHIFDFSQGDFTFTWTFTGGKCCSTLSRQGSVSHKCFNCWSSTRYYRAHGRVSKQAHQ